MPYLTHAGHDNRLTEAHCELLLWLLESRKTFLQSVDLGEVRYSWATPFTNKGGGISMYIIACQSL